MSLTYESAGGIFDRIGAIYRFIVAARAEAGATGVAGRWPYEVNDVYYKVRGASNVIQEAVDVVPNGLNTAQAGVVQMFETLKAAAQTILIEQMDAQDNLPEKTVAEALRVLIEQMTVDTKYVTGNTVTASVTDSASDGDGVLICSVLDGRGRTLENVLAEDILCQRDETAQQFLCRGEAAAESKLAVNWPQGSGCNESVTVTDAANDDILINGSFEAFTANAPDDWSIIAGAAGTQILEELTTKLAGDSALEFVGHATGANIRQDITERVESRTPYAVNLFYKLDSDPAAGVLTVDLYDGTSVIADDAGTNNTMAVSLPGVNDTNWHALNAFFRLPEPLPAAVYLRVRLSTALSAGTSVFIDQLAMVEAARLYDGGPYVASFVGGTAFSQDDVFTIAIANNRTGKYQEACDVLFDTLEDDVRLPTAGVSLIANSYPTYEGV